MDTGTVILILACIAGLAYLFHDVRRVRRERSAMKFRPLARLNVNQRKTAVMTAIPYFDRDAAFDSFRCINRETATGFPGPAALKRIVYFVALNDDLPESEIRRLIGCILSS